MLFKGRGGETDPAGFLKLFSKFWRERQETKKQAEAYTAVEQSGFFSRSLILRKQGGIKFWLERGAGLWWISQTFNYIFLKTNYYYEVILFHVNGFFP